MTTSTQKSRRRRARLVAAGLTTRGTERKQRPKTYDGWHKRHRKALAGRPCEFADETCQGRLEVALRHGANRLLVDLAEAARGKTGIYSEHVEDYRMLCVSHHVRYDEKGFAA